MLTFIDDKVFQLELEEENQITQQLHIRVGKRLFDLLVASLVTILILVWLIPVIGLLVMISSPGPPLFIQSRTGRNGRPFRCLKFRTMTYERNPTFQQAKRNDNRVTKIGSFLRKTNLDEMPQFLNVLMGHMSVVGPRPHAIQHDAEYWASIPDYRKRYTVLPGITGLAQVRGARGLIEDDLKMQHRLRYDLFYIKKCSFWQDVQICWWTVESTFKGDVNAF